MRNKEFNNAHFKSGIKFICDYGYTPQRSIEELIANGAGDEEANAIIEYIMQEVEDEIKRRRKKEKVMEAVNRTDVYNISNKMNLNIAKLIKLNVVLNGK